MNQDQLQRLHDLAKKSLFLDDVLLVEFGLLAEEAVQLIISQSRRIAELKAQLRKPSDPISKHTPDFLAALIGIRR